MAATEAELRKILGQLIAKEAQIDKAKLVPEATLKSLDVDSLDMSMVLMAIEEKFDIYLSIDSDLEQIETYNDLVEMLLAKVRRHQGAATES